MTLYIGVDFHPHQQTLAWCDMETGEIRTRDLPGDPETVRQFYSSLPEPATVGIEASPECRLLLPMITCGIRYCMSCLLRMFPRRW